MPKVLNRALQLGGEDLKIGTPVVTVLEFDSDGNVTRAKGATVPTDADKGYAKGCRFIQTDGTLGTTEYINEGSASSADFNPVRVDGAPADAEIVTATNAITAAESGKTFFLDSATEFASTLPAPALGLKYTFIVKTAPSGASYTVVTTSSANIIKGLQNSVAGDAGDSGTADDTITFVDGQAVAGDKVEVISDGTSWFAYAISKVAAGITFTQAS
jgi:hypothetical protein